MLYSLQNESEIEDISTTIGAFLPLSRRLRCLDWRQADELQFRPWEVIILCRSSVASGVVDLDFIRASYNDPVVEVREFEADGVS